MAENVASVGSQLIGIFQTISLGNYIAECKEAVQLLSKPCIENAEEAVNCCLKVCRQAKSDHIESMVRGACNLCKEGLRISNYSQMADFLEQHQDKFLSVGGYCNEEIGAVEELISEYQKSKNLSTLEGACTKSSKLAQQQMAHGGNILAMSHLATSSVNIAVAWYQINKTRQQLRDCGIAAQQHEQTLNQEETVINEVRAAFLEILARPGLSLVQRQVEIEPLNVILQQSQNRVDAVIADLNAQKTTAKALRMAHGVGFVNSLLGLVSNVTAWGAAATFGRVAIGLNGLSMLIHGVAYGECRLTLAQLELVLDRALLLRRDLEQLQVEARLGVPENALQARVRAIRQGNAPRPVALNPVHGG